MRRHVQQRALGEGRHQAGIRTLREDGRRPAALVQPVRQRLLAQRIVGALRRRQPRIVVASRPGLVAGVEVERAALAAEADQRQARHVDGEVQQEVTLAQQRLEHGLVVAFAERGRDHLDAVLRRDPGLVGQRLDDADAGRLDAEFAGQHRQHRLPDAAEPQHHEPPRERGALPVVFHPPSFPSRRQCPRPGDAPPVSSRKKLL
jgi:hypothetical protein